MKEKMTPVTSQPLRSPTADDAGGQAPDQSTSHTDREYILDTGSELGREQLNYLQQFFDPITILCLEPVGIKPGWRCLGLGADGGSITRWLAERTGPMGTVVAVDIDTEYLDE